MKGTYPRGKSPKEDKKRRGSYQFRQGKSRKSNDHRFNAK